jgi:hypothetical protein
MWTQPLYDLRPTTNVCIENDLRIYLISRFLYRLYFNLSYISTAPKRKMVIEKRVVFNHVHFDVTTRDIISKFINTSDSSWLTISLFIIKSSLYRPKKQANLAFETSCFIRKISSLLQKKIMSVTHTPALENLWEFCAMPLHVVTFSYIYQPYMGYHQE